MTFVWRTQPHRESSGSSRAKAFTIDRISPTISSIGYLAQRMNESRKSKDFAWSSMETHSDFKELLELFNAEQVEYLIVGGYAVAYHGAPRYTGDIDLLVRTTKENASRVLRALDRFGFGDTGLTEDDFTNPDQVTQLGRPPVRVDILTSIDGVTWDEAWEAHEGGSYAGVAVPYLGRETLIRNKRASARAKDLADLEALLGERDSGESK